MLPTAQVNRQFWYLKVLEVDESYYLTLWRKNTKNKHMPYSSDHRSKQNKTSWGRIVSCSVGKQSPYNITPYLLNMYSAFFTLLWWSITCYLAHLHARILFMKPPK